MISFIFRLNGELAYWALPNVCWGQKTWKLYQLKITFFFSFYSCKLLSESKMRDIWRQNQTNYTLLLYGHLTLSSLHNRQHFNNHTFSWPKVTKTTALSSMSGRINSYHLHSPFTASAPRALSSVAYSKTAAFLHCILVRSINTVNTVFLVCFIGNDYGNNNWNKKYRWNWQSSGQRKGFHLVISDWSQ